jgi:hypothetical protein
VTALGEAAKGLAEVFVPSATKADGVVGRGADGGLAAIGRGVPASGAVLVRPDGERAEPDAAAVLAFGTLGLFIYAMVDPVAFAHRMVGLNAVPEPLWWLLGAIVAFYFGARETHYFRTRGVSLLSSGRVR